MTKGEYDIMEDPFEKIAHVGIVPVIRLEKPEAALPSEGPSWRAACPSPK
jgi:hypothetical protein